MSVWGCHSVRGEASGQLVGANYLPPWCDSLEWISGLQAGHQTLLSIVPTH